MPKQITIPPARWITREVAQHLRASSRSIANYRNKKGLPHILSLVAKILALPAVEWPSKVRLEPSMTSIDALPAVELPENIILPLKPLAWSMGR